MTTQFNPFRDLDRMLGSQLARPSYPGMPMDLFRAGDEYIAEFDLPGVDPESIDIDIDERTLTVRAERAGRADDVEWLTHERPTGTFARQLTLGYGVALDKIEAAYDGGVLTVRFPVAEEAKPRKISVSTKEQAKTIDAS